MGRRGPRCPTLTHPPNTPTVRVATMDIGSLFSSFSQTAFRLEGLPLYDIPDDRHAFESFQETGVIPVGFNRGWGEFVSNSVQSGKSVARLRLISSPPTTYELFELAAYEVGASAGEDIRVVQHGDLPFEYDFWLFDGIWLARMNYSSGGTFLGSDVRRLDGDDEQNIRKWLSEFDRAPALPSA